MNNAERIIRAIIEEQDKDKIISLMQELRAYKKQFIELPSEVLDTIKKGVITSKGRTYTFEDKSIMNFLEGLIVNFHDQVGNEITPNLSEIELAMRQEVRGIIEERRRKITKEKILKRMKGYK